MRSHDVVQLLRELRIDGQFELLDPVRLKAMRPPDASDCAGANGANLDHHGASPVRGFARRIGKRQFHHPFGDVRTQERNARWPRLVAQKPFHAFCHEPLLSAPDARLGLAGPVHDLVRAQTFGRKQNDLRLPDMLLRRIAVLRNRPQPLAIPGH